VFCLLRHTKCVLTTQYYGAQSWYHLLALVDGSRSLGIIQFNRTVKQKGFLIQSGLVHLIRGEEIQVKKREGKLG